MQLRHCGLVFDDAVGTYRAWDDLLIDVADAIQIVIIVIARLEFRQAAALAGTVTDIKGGFRLRNDEGSKGKANKSFAELIVRYSDESKSLTIMKERVEN